MYPPKRFNCRRQLYPEVTSDRFAALHFPLPMDTHSRFNKAIVIFIDGSRETEHFPNLNEVVSRHIRRALAKSNGRIHGPKGAAEMLKLNPST